ncbi:MAG TPA: HD domain-containing phosphohydrolase [Terriglobia bacterium]|nr:HD domain-containing phosphohydrolase [Terriglobia bacterium]
MEPGAKTARILVVDDDAQVCKLLCETLALEGFDCRGAGSGSEALREFDREPCDLIISDLRMPGMSGLDLLKAARGRDAHLAFIMVTAENDLRVGIEAMKQGAADYVVKPFQRDVVRASVERALERRRLERDLERYRLHLEDRVRERTRQLQGALERVEQTYDETLAALGAALELRDSQTQGHSRRVTRYCLEIARAFDCSDDELKNIARGSFLHDIGKIGVPDSILLKPGALTPDEAAVMRRHAQTGYDLVCRIAFLAPAAEIVLSHQERYDGRGYPRGLRGEAIPLGSRIFAVADALDAMTSDRPYRRARPFAEAREEIRRESGRQFDPEVVRVFLSISEPIWQAIREEVTETSGVLALLAKAPTAHEVTRPSG